MAAADTDQARGLWVDPRGGAVEFRGRAQRWFATRTVPPTTSAADHGRYANHLAPAFGAMPLKNLARCASGPSSPSCPRGARPRRCDTCTRCCPRCCATPSSAAQLQLVLAAVDPFYRCLVLTAAGTGMRWGELTGLRRDRLDLPGRRLHIDQTLIDVNGRLSVGQPTTRGSRRTVSLPRPVVAALHEHLAGASGALVFTSPDAQPLRRSNFHSRVWVPAVRATGVVPPPRFHDYADVLRHTHVALLIAAGVPVKAIQERLGHASIVMTMGRYGHLLEVVDEQLLAALDVGLTATPEAAR